ncbi:MAG TPA: hypothetical protein VM802_31495 [Chitinophaga sp.]|uniref:hypothetical protein n=1 Tax=Chitinophaga sp. TaxID=1869181 RepID=UPI002C40C27C|nr:hypothetical protein [Chitinophaga sp.]HVI49433.1 hypothetical protein [Chitinophaga sp.]
MWHMKHPARWHNCICDEVAVYDDVSCNIFYVDSVVPVDVAACAHAAEKEASAAVVVTEAKADAADALEPEDAEAAAEPAACAARIWRQYPSSTSLSRKTEDSSYSTDFIVEDKQAVAHQPSFDSNCFFTLSAISEIWQP